MRGVARFGKFRLIAELGRGGMADVFLALQPGPPGSRIRKLSVLKRLRQNLAEDPEFIAMLMDEARIAARLNHPNVVQTYEVDSFEEQYFIAMEYLDGQPLHRIQHRATSTKNRPVFQRDEQFVVLMDTLAGLQHAHALADFDGTPLGIVHRDVTPHNVFVTYDGQTKIVDFGIAKAAGRANETRQGVVKGKIRYMAPEQATGSTIDHRTDLFAAGIMLWEMATSKRIWGTLDDFQIVQALVNDEIPRSPRDADPSVPPAIDAICRRALATKLHDRYASASEFRDDLEAHLEETGALISSRKKIASSMNELFREKRVELRMIIEQHLSDLDRELESESDLAPGRPSAGRLSRASVTSVQASPSILEVDPHANADEETQLAQGASKRESGTLVMAAASSTSLPRASVTGSTRSFTGPLPPTAPPAQTSPQPQPQPQPQPRLAARPPADDANSRFARGVLFAAIGFTGIVAVIVLAIFVVRRPPPPPSDAHHPPSVEKGKAR